MLPLISVVTPVHISTHKQLDYLRDLIVSFSRQRYTNKELIISDDVGDARVESLCHQMNTPGLNIKYYAAPVKGISSNLNFGISKARGKYVKILFHDDFFVKRYALLTICIRLTLSKKTWHVSASTHFQQSTSKFINTFYPRISDALLEGKNSISSPSVVTFKTFTSVTFCSELDYLMDCEWYLRMSHNFGSPIFGKIVFVANRLHENQATHWAQNQLQIESVIAKNIHEKSKMSSRNCKCLL